VVAIVVTLIVGVVSFFLFGIGGYTQRLLFLLYSAWMIVVGGHVLRVGGAEAAVDRR
jgi:hypothetical protein